MNNVAPPRPPAAGGERFLPWALPLLFPVLAFLSWPRAADSTMVRLPVAALFCAGMFYYFARSDERFLPPVSRPVLACLAGILGASLFSALFAWYPAALGNGLARVLLGLGLLLAASRLPVSPWLVPAWAGIGLILSGIAIGDANRAGEFFFLPLFERAIPRHVTPLGNRNFFAGYLALLAPVTAAFAFARARERLFLRASPVGGGISFRARSAGVQALLFGTFTLFFLFLLVKVGSRAALGGALLGILFFLALVAWHLLANGLRSQPGRRLLKSFLVAFFAAAALYGGVEAARVARREIRRHIFRGTLNMILDRPWTGVGPGSFLAAFQQYRPPGYYAPGMASTPISDQSHNEFLQVAAETGIPGLLAFLALLVVIYRFSLGSLAISAARPRGPPGRAPGVTGLPGDERWFLLAGLVSGVTALLADGMLSSNLRTYTVGPMFWLVLGLCARLAGEVAPAGRERSSDREIPAQTGRAGKDVLPRHYLPWTGATLAMLLAGLFLFRQVNSHAYYQDGVIMRKMGAWEDAEHFYRQSLRWDPSHLQVSYRLAYILPMTGRFEEAVALYEQILEVSPNFAMTHVNLARIYYRAGMTGEALAHARARLRYNPHDELALEIIDQIMEGIPAGMPEIHEE